MRFFTPIVIFLLSGSLIAQDLPASKMLLMDAKLIKSSMTVSNLQYLSGDNEGNYNNQPQFVGDKLLVTMSLDGKQTDIYLLDPNTRERTRLTWTTSSTEWSSIISEYSPTLIPGGSHFSFVTVEKNGVQRLWKAPLDGFAEPELILENATNVAYHKWISSNKIALFLLDDPHSLQLYDIEEDKFVYVASSIGRCLQVSAKGTLVYISKRSDTWYVKEYIQKRRMSRSLVKAMSDSEDFVFWSDRVLLTGKGSKLYKFDLDRDNGWVLVADLSKYGVNDITRLAANKSRKLAIVFE